MRRSEGWKNVLDEKNSYERVYDMELVESARRLDEENFSKTKKYHKKENYWESNLGP
jgi:hypothetical protein